MCILGTWIKLGRLTMDLRWLKCQQRKNSNSRPFQENQYLDVLQEESEVKQVIKYAEERL